MVLVAGCRRAPANTYPPEVEEGFLRSCATRVDRRMCRCALDQLEERYTVDEFRAFEARVVKGEIPKEIADAVAACR